MGIDRYVYAANDTTWVATFMERIEKQSKGYNAVSLSNYDATGVCVITDGSAFEIAGSMYLCTTDTSITASCATGVCYIMATGATATASVAWSTTAPVWRDDLQGYYATAASVVRAIGGCYYDDAGDYRLKWTYTNRHAGPKTGYDNFAFTGISDSQSTYQLAGRELTAFDPAAAIGAWLGVQIPRDSIITQLSATCETFVDGDVVLTLYYANDDGDGTAMAAVTLNGVETQTDTTIVGPRIDYENYHYYVYLNPATSATMNVTEVKITYTEIVRC